MSEPAITDVVHLYSTALDSHSWDLFDLIFTQDAVNDYPGGFHWSDLASFKRDFAAMHEPLAGHMHQLGNPVVLVEGARAWTLTYGTFRLFATRRAEKFGEMNEGGAWYDDELVLTPSGWRIRHSRARNFWWRGIMPEDGDYPTAVDSFPEEAKAGRVGYITALRETLGR